MNVHCGFFNRGKFSSQKKFNIDNFDLLELGMSKGVVHNDLTLLDVSQKF